VHAQCIAHRIAHSSQLTALITTMINHHTTFDRTPSPDNLPLPLGPYLSKPSVGSTHLHRTANFSIHVFLR
jgi:hypothetical protein